MKHALVMAFLSVLFLSASELRSETSLETREFRGIWVITWEIFLDNGDLAKGETLRGEKLKIRIRTILDNVKKAGLNAVIWQVRQSGTAYYPSTFEPWGKYAGGQSPGFDPVAFTLSEAHKRGLEFHAWFNSFESNSNAPGSPAVRHPTWIVTDKAGTAMPRYFCLSPGMAEVREYLANLIGDFVTNYAVDGVHLDYIRWNEYRWTDMNSDFEKEGNGGYGEFLYDLQHPLSKGVPEGFATWDEWRREMVTQTVALIRATINRIRPDVILSVAAIGKYNWGIWNGHSAVFQDAPLWLRFGLIDQIMAMNYQWTTPLEMSGGLEGNCPNCWIDYLRDGLNLGGTFSAGIASYRLASLNLWNNHVSLVEAVRQSTWAVGMQFFSYGTWEAKNYFEDARKQLFPSTKTVPDAQ